ncbi:MAG: helix-turn-helix domain-containing protein [Bacteroidia bacterium]|nr:helix-turn-helix domain-containing protein [Bacteroidia bacterium]
MKTESTQIKLKPYSITELARIYGVDPRTLKKWIVPFEKEIGTKQGRFYQIPQVKIIFDKLSLPTDITIAA